MGILLKICCGKKVMMGLCPFVINLFQPMLGFLYLIDEMITYCLNKEIDYALDYKRDSFERLMNLGKNGSNRYR